MRPLTVLLPDRFFAADRLTMSARRLLMRIGVAAIGIAIAGVAAGLLDSNNWSDVAAGALFAWATSFVVWAVSSYRTGTEEVSKELRRMAEFDLLHARLNHLAHDRGLPLVDLQAEVESVLVAREERLAHFAGLEEFRPTSERVASDWWDDVALGANSPRDD